MFIKTPFCPPRHIFITSKCQDLAPPSSELTSHCPPVGEPPLPRLVTEGVGQGWGNPLYILCHTNPQVLILAGFVFILIFFLVLIFLNKNFHFKHIYTEVCCVLGGAGFRAGREGWALGEGSGLKGASPLSLQVPVPPTAPSPAISSSVFSLKL